MDSLADDDPTHPPDLSPSRDRSVPPAQHGLAILLPLHLPNFVRIIAISYNRGYTPNAHCVKISNSQAVRFIAGAIMLNTDNCTWKPIVGHHGYEVSRCGKIRSTPRVVIRSNGVTLTIPGKILKTPPNKGYPRFNASCNGIRTQMWVHQCVAAAFIGPVPNGHEVRHRNGNRSDNRVENLAYGTRQDNVNDAKQHGTIIRGSVKSSSKLTEAQAIEIYLSTETAASLASAYQVSAGTIDSVRSRRCWNHATKHLPDRMRIRRSHNSKLTADDVIDIRGEFARGVKQVDIASMYGLNKQSVYHIVNRHSWKHV